MKTSSVKKQPPVQREPSKRTRKPSAVATLAATSKVATRVSNRRAAAAAAAVAVKETPQIADVVKKASKASPAKPVNGGTVASTTNGIAAEPKKRGRKPKTKEPEPQTEPEVNNKKPKTTKAVPKPRKVKETNNNVTSPPSKAKEIPVAVADDESEKNDSPVKSKKYRCEICSKNFLGSNDLRKHLRIHSDERPYECSQCDKKFRQGGCLKNHIASQHGTDIAYQCDYCGKAFPIKERLRLHIRIHTGEKPYNCDFCSKKFARGGQLTQHLISHTGIRKYKCHYCPVTFSSAANMRLHMKTHLDQRDYTCHLCGKGFYRPDALKKHILCYHQNIRAFHCKICNKMLKGHLPQHKRTHRHIKKHGCGVCGAAFSQRSQLVVHQRVHSGERPYRCQVCWRAFAHSSVLKLHIRKHTGEKPFKCPLCVDTKLGFSQLPHLKKHLKSIHNQDKPYQCDNCKAFFKTKLDIQQHSFDCIKAEVVGSVEEFIERAIQIQQSTVIEPPMPVHRMRLLIAILLKKISAEERLRQLGYEKRLIDNVLVDSLKCAGRKVCEDTELSEAQRLKLNVQEFLEWTVPEQYMENYKRNHRSTEEILEELTN